MNTIIVKNELKAGVVANEIVTSIKSKGEVVVYPFGTDVINRAISAIDIAKKSLQEDEIALSVEPELFEIKTKNYAKTTMTFQLKIQPFIVEIAHIKEDYRGQCLN